MAQEEDESDPPIEMLYPSTVRLTLDRAKLEEVVNKAVGYVIQQMFPSSMSERGEGVKLIKAYIEPIVVAKVQSTHNLSAIDDAVTNAMNTLTGGNLETYIMKSAKEYLDDRVKKTAEELGIKVPSPKKSRRKKSEL